LLQAVVFAKPNFPFNDTLLTYVDYYTEDDKFYATSSEGFCVVDEVKNTAQIYVRVKEQEFTDGPVIDSAVTYLNSFDEFPKRAQEIFLQMDSFWADKDEREYNLRYTKDSDGIVRPFTHSLRKQRIDKFFEKIASYAEWLPWNN